MVYYANDLLTSVSDLFAKLLNWISANFSIVLQLVFIFVFALIANKICRHLFGKLLDRSMRSDMFPSKTDRERRIKTLNSITGAIIGFVVWAVAVLMIMGTLNVNTAPLLASAGILSVAIGFGAQSLVKDFVTGLFIIAENQYRVGDYVEIQNIKGIVKSVTMRTTVIQDIDGSIFYIPNGSIIVTSNHTMNNDMISIELSTPATTDIDKFCNIINLVGKKQAESADMKDLIIEPVQFKRINQIKGDLVFLRATGRVRAGKQMQVKSDYYLLIQQELIKNKITLK